MTFSVVDFKFKKLINYVDWKLLLFLLLFLNVKLEVKIPAIILCYLLQFNFKFKFGFKNSRLPLFYLAVIIITFVDLMITGSYTKPGYLLTFIIGLGFWVLCILAIHQIKLFVENNDTETVHRTILVFFVINIILSVYSLVHIIWSTGAINPYEYQGQYQKYFVGTGDYIKGITFDSSTTNAVLNAFGVVYFLTRKNYLMVILCMLVLLLTASNFTNLALISVLALLFVFKSTRDQKSFIVICLSLMVVFMIKISPQNDQYTVETVKNTFHEKPPAFLNTLAIDKKPDDKISPEFIKRKFAQDHLDSLAAIDVKNHPRKPLSPEIWELPKTKEGRIFMEGPKTAAPFYQASKIATPEQTRLLGFINKHKTSLPISGQANFDAHEPGKILAFFQTLRFLEIHPAKILTGDGIGNFSSKLAFRATGLGFAGSYPESHTYISDEFFLNHLDIYLNFFSKKGEFQSLTNSPNSVYDQLLIEYGVLGLLAFAIYYLWFFTKHYKKLTYGIPLLLLLLSVFFIDYWFEQLSIVVFFELLLFLDIKQTTNKTPVNYGY